MRFASAAAFVAVGLALPVSGTVLVPTFTSCIDNYELVADPSAQFNITNVFASLVPGAHAAQQKLEGGGVDVLRLNIMGTLQQQLEEYNSTTSKLGE
jgi:hypothetical protein